MMPIVPPDPAALAEEDLLITAWNAGFGAPPVPARGGTQAGEDRGDRAAGFSEKISGYGDRTPAVSSDAGGLTSGFGNQMADASNKQKIRLLEFETLTFGHPLLTRCAPASVSALQPSRRPASAAASPAIAIG